MLLEQAPVGADGEQHGEAVDVGKADVVNGGDLGGGGHPPAAEFAGARADALVEEGVDGATLPAWRPPLNEIARALGRAVEDVGEDVLTRPADVDRLLERTLGDGSAELDERAAG